jgi:hypothetical protein
MYTLKPISAAAIPEALEKAWRYRLLNEPFQAESICLDVLEVEPDNQHALAVLLLSRTDQFGQGVSCHKAREAAQKMTSEYDRAYYSGVISERWAGWLLRHGTPGAGFNAYEYYRQAMDWYERAENLRPAGNDDALLRWNTCARLLMSNPEVRPRGEEAFEPAFED